MVLLAWGLWTFLMSFGVLRGIVSYPLFVHNPEAHGDAAYVMSDGDASWERLRMASDLYHMHRVDRIIVSDEQESSGYNFVQHRSDKRVDRVIAYLKLFGVPEEKISTVPAYPDAALGSLSEARSVANEEKELERIVVVTSAPHTRRSRLCFRRAMPEDVDVDVYSASEGPSEGSELYSPIWVEYCKLVVYYLFA